MDSIMASEKTESNRLYTKKWVGDTLHYETITGKRLAFNRQRASIKIRDQAELYGFDVKMQRMFAVSATEFPSSRDRADEGARRTQEWIDHVYSGSDDWEAPKKGFTRSVSRADVEEALDRAYPGKGQVLFARKFDEAPKDRTPELAVIETVRYWLQTKQVAAAWATIQAERKAAAAASFGDADDEVERLLGGK
jgi:hypothetical protein